jgi:hypothetical protein
MIINSIADGNVDSKGKVTFKFRNISYTIETKSKKLSGEVLASTYEDVDVAPLGSAPYTVTLGYVNHSYQAQPVVVDSPDAMVTFWMAFPAGPNTNGPESFVFNAGPKTEKQK